MKFYVLLVLLFITGMIESKSLDNSNDFETKNQIEHENGVKSENEIPDISKNLSGQGESSPAPTENTIDQKIEINDATTEESISIKPQQPDKILNLLLPLLHRWKFTPQTFFNDRLNSFKQSLGNLGFYIPSNNATSSKQFATTNALSNLVGLNGSGFYTNRLEPAGFLDGNGWFANKGGILGGPGAIISTGSLLTDYPTPYRK